EVGLGELATAEPVVPHARLQLGDVKLGVGEVLDRSRRGGSGLGFLRWGSRFVVAAEQAQAEQGRDEHAHGISPINEDRPRILFSRERFQPWAFATERHVGATEVATFVGKAFATSVAPTSSG